MEDNKLGYALKKCKIVFVIILVLWVLISIVLIMPTSVAIVDSTVEGKISLEQLITNMTGNMSHIFSNFGKVFTGPYIGTFLKGEVYLVLTLLVCATIGIVKTMPKNNYSDIEHGSSDWATAEKYSILNKNKGIILAEKHYLPVDKRGNVNVLVVGRFRFW